MAPEGDTCILSLTLSSQGSNIEIRKEYYYSLIIALWEN